MQICQFLLFFNALLSSKHIFINERYITSIITKGRLERVCHCSLIPFLKTNVAKDTF